MNSDIKLETAMQNADAVEAMHWSPPAAPMEMPRQVLERDGAGQGGGVLMRLFAFFSFA